MSARRLSTTMITTIVAFMFIGVGEHSTASVHLTNLTEVFAGTSGDSSAQFIEIQLRAANNNLTNGSNVTVTDAAGTNVGTFTFSSNVPNGADQAYILVATAEAETLFDIQADLMMTPVIDPAGGKACFSGSVDCVSWGNYSGSSAGTGTPAPAIPAGSSLIRDTSGGQDPSELDGGDDTNNSAADFDVGSPSPTNNAGTIGTPPGRTVQFAASTFNGDENAAGAVSVTVTGSGEGDVTVDYALSDGTATAGEDYGADSGTLTFESNSNQFPVLLIDDEIDESSETVNLTLSNPTGATLGLSNATFRIIDDDGPADSSPPESHIFFPQHREAYKNVRQIQGSSTDDDSGVAGTEFALRRKLTNGNCKWWNGRKFVAGGCGAKQFQDAEGVGEWGYELSSKLGSSKGTKTKFYTAYARATDVAGNVESSFEKGRNANRFEIK